MTGRRGLFLLLAAPFGAKPAHADELTEAGLAFFRDFEARSARFDPGLADLYADDARITTRRLTPDGDARTLYFHGVQWKTMIRHAMPVARQRGDVNSYSDVAARIQGPNLVLVEAQRFNRLKSYTSPFALLLRRDARGAWRISEEWSETRP